jgi:uncharacterized delta-60 repeat protein
MLRSVWARLTNPRARRPAAPPRPFCRPCLERLEDRTLLSAGDFDPTFGVAGKVLTPFGGTVDLTPADAALQSDGKLVVVGTASTGMFFALRYTPDGQLDRTFGAGGGVLDHFQAAPASAADSATGLAVPDGKVVIVGATDGRFAVLRLNADGTRDGTFGTGGVLLGPPDGSTSSHPFASADDVLVQPDGKLLVGGGGDLAARQVSPAAGFLARYRADGSADFGPVPTAYGVHRLALQPDGKILAWGTGGNGIPTAARYLADGTPDPGFTSSADGFEFALQPDGRVVAFGSTPGPRPGFAVRRYLPDRGDPDPGFGSGGVTLVDDSASASGFRVGGLLVQPDGRIVAAGTTAGGTGDDFLLATLNPDGSFDAGFGAGGAVRTDFAADSDVARALLRQPDGKLIMVGSAAVNGSRQVALARYEADTAPTVSVDDNARFVTNLYVDAFGRKPDSEELSLALWYVDAARSSILGMVATGYVTSVENRIHTIAGEYMQFLRRPASPQEVNRWLAFLQQGRTPEQVIARIVASPEYYQRAGGTDAAWLDLVFLDLLGRPRRPNVPNDSLFPDALQFGATREDVVNAILASPDYWGPFVRGVYNQYLDRQPSEAEVSQWAGVLFGPVTNPGPVGAAEQFLAFVLASSEFFRNSGNSSPGWLDHLYTRLLGRLPDAAGLQAALTTLLVGMGTPFEEQFGVGGYQEQRYERAARLAFFSEGLSKPIAEAYTTYLRRAATPEEIDRWATVLVQGARIEQVVAIILGSPEYFQLAGGTNAGWLNRLVPDLAGRDPGRFRPLFQAVIDRGGDRAQTALSILTSAEYRSYQIGTEYLALLGRDAAPVEADFWARALLQGATLDQVRARIFSSPEYFLRPRRGL